MTLTTERMELRLDLKTLEEVDAAVDQTHLDNRQAFVKIAIREKLERLKMLNEAKELIQK